MNAVLDKRVDWTVTTEGIGLRLGNVRMLVPHDAVLQRWTLEGRWFEEELDRRYYRVQLPDGRIGDFYENAQGQYLERWWDRDAIGGSERGGAE